MNIVVALITVFILPVENKHRHSVATVNPPKVTNRKEDDDDDDDDGEDEEDKEEEQKNEVNQKDLYDENGDDITKPPITEADAVHLPGDLGKVESGGQKDKPPKKSCWSIFLESWADDEGFVRLCSTTVLTIVCSVLGAAVMYAIEHGSSCQWNFWDSLWFVNTLITSIGYGTLSPCTNGGRAATVVIALICIPINLLALNDLGKLLARFLNLIWEAFAKCFRRCGCCKPKITNPVDPVTPGHEQTPEERDKAPLSIAVVVTVLWYLLSSAYFTLTEPGNMDFPTAFYYVMISVTTIGLGDVDVSRYDLVIPEFFFTIIGMAMLSMCIKFVQQKVEMMENEVEDMIKKEYAQSQQTGAIMEADHAKDHVKNLLKQKDGGGLFRFAMSKDKEQRLTGDFLDKANRRIVGVQTEPDVKNKHVQAVKHHKDVDVQAGSKLRCKCDEEIKLEDKSTQLRMDMTSSLHLDWVDLSFKAKRKQPNDDSG